MEERVKNWRFRPISRFISKTVKDTAIVTVKDESYAIYRIMPFQVALSDP